MFSSFSDEAQRVVGLAQWEARRLGSQQVGTEHILLGLLRAGETAATRALMALGIDLEQLSFGVEKRFRPKPGGESCVLPFTARAGQVLNRLALCEARELGQEQVGPEHLLLGLIREGEGLAAIALDEAGVNLAEARTVVRLSAGGSARLAPKGDRSHIARALDRPGVLKEPDRDHPPLNRRSPVSASTLEARRAAEFDRAVRVVNRALLEAADLESPELRVEHLLLAVLADQEAADVVDLLRIRGVTLEWLRNHFRS